MALAPELQQVQQGKLLRCSRENLSQLRPCACHSVHSAPMQLQQTVCCDKQHSEAPGKKRC